jgi:transposase
VQSKSWVSLEKKTFGYKERNEQKREVFIKTIAEINPRNLVYMDEAGIDDNDAYPYAYARKGQRAFAFKPGTKKKRVSIIASLRNNALIAPFVLDGYCDTEVMLVYFKDVLLPTLSPGHIIVMDNASFHKSIQLQQLVWDAGCEILFLPAYSPDFNPIEHWWFMVKNRIRKKLSLYDFNINQAVIDTFREIGAC